MLYFSFKKSKKKKRIKYKPEYKRTDKKFNLYRFTTFF